MSTRNSSTSAGVGKPRRKIPVEYDAYERHLARAKAQGNWFWFCRDYVLSGVMNKMQALILQDIINLAGLRSTKKDEEGFFMCSVEYLENSLCWEKETQRKLIGSLCPPTKIFKNGKGFIETKLAGLPAHRWIRINMFRIEEAVDKGYMAIENQE